MNCESAPGDTLRAVTAHLHCRICALDKERGELQELLAKLQGDQTKLEAQLSLEEAKEDTQGVR